MKSFLKPFLKLILFALIIGFITRIILLFNGQTISSFSVMDYAKIFVFGAINDICIAFIGTLLIYINLILVSDIKYKKPWGYILLGLFVLAFLYLSAFNTLLDEYSKGVSKVVRWLVLYKCISFGLRMYLPKIRKGFSLTVFGIGTFIYVTSFLINAIGEYFFWSEFGVRYNFIAVDYLVYTNEVIGNIYESYPVIPIFGTIALISLAITYYIMKINGKIQLQKLNFGEKLVTSTAYVILFALSCLIIKGMTTFQNEKNVYVNELQANGLYKFYCAFLNNKLDYDKFYVTLSKKQVFSIINSQNQRSGVNNIQQVKGQPIESGEIHKNIVLIMVESLSAEYLAHFGSTDNITPSLDSLCSKSLVFENLYANGNRTVRGLEAVSLCIPPSPGESVIKRKNNANLFSVATVLKEKGYTVQFLYGGDSYFDNMRTFFSGNGYDIIDKKSLTSKEKTFSTIWGVCDEDMFNKALKVFDKNSLSKKPFFAHIMTVSNHRPYTYPENKIDISPKSKSRKGGVKYTDYAIGKFISEAKKHAWFNNTVFIIMADHCASSAGKTDIPLNKYHIPAIVYAPDFIKPQQVTALTSQIDVMPTIFGLLHFSYSSKFYGQDVFAPYYKSRAFVATYQNLGYLEDNIFTVLSPVRRVEQYDVKPDAHYTYSQTLRSVIDKKAQDKAVANYQSLEYILK